MDEILNLATHMVIIQDGRIPAYGPLADILSRPDLQRYLSWDESGTIISAVVDIPKDDFDLTHLRFGNQILKVQNLSVSRGEAVRVRIPARNVAIALAPPGRTSFQNIFPGQVEAIQDSGAAFMDIQLNIGCTLWARITRQSCLELGLKPGLSVFALIKTVAVSPGRLSVHFNT